MSNRVLIYTDGACRGNPGPGGWGVILKYKDITKELSGAQDNTTNNRMELLAAIKGLEALKGKQQVILTTDSQYLRNGITKWIIDWKDRGWKTANKKAVKNQDLWHKLCEMTALHDVQWEWVRGHSGHLENERADELANQAIDRLQQK